MAQRLIIVSRLSALALRPLLGDGADAIVQSVVRRLADSSESITIALERSQLRAWQALEVSLAGESWWQRCKSILVNSGDDRAFRSRIQAFLATTADEPAAVDTEFRGRCLAELREARRRGVLPGERLPPQELPAQATAFIHYADPRQVLDAEWRAVNDVAKNLNDGGFPNLARFVALRPVQGLPLLVLAARYFFRREIETDAELSRGLTFHQLDQLAQAQEAGLRGIYEALTQQGARLEQLLADVRQSVTEAREEIREVRDIVTDSRDELGAIRAQLDEQNRQMRELYAALQQALAQNRLIAPPMAAAPSVEEPLPAPPAGMPAADPGEQRRQVKILLDHCRHLTPDERKKAAGVIRLADKLELAADAYDAARRRAFPFLTTDAPTQAPDPVAPPIKPKVPKPSHSSLRQVRGSPINEALFAAPRPPEEAEPPAAPPKPPTINPLFLPKPTPPDSPTGDASSD